MIRWRLSVAIVLLFAVAFPAAIPFIELIQQPEGWLAWSELGRLLSLASNTIALAAGTLALALPIGIALAVLFYRSDLPLRGWLRFLVLLCLFVPLPLFATAWQAALGTTGWLPLTFWTPAAPGDPDVSPQGVLVKPWAYGLVPVIWVQTVASLPWVILLVGQALVWVERELEEDMLTVVGRWRVLWFVTLPRCRVAIFAAGLWIVLQTATEITITDMMQVRTFAEEVYTQIVAGDRFSLARAVASALPATLVVAALVLWVTRRWEQTLPALNTLSPPFCLVRLGKARWPVFAVVFALMLAITLVPVGSLVWKAGLAGSPPSWSAGVMSRHLITVVHVRGLLVLESTGLAIVAGIVTVVVGLVTCWLARESSWFRALALGIMAVSWAVAGPIIGLGLNAIIQRVSEPYWLAVVLYYGPSPVPALWAQFIRFLPCAIALLWPMVRFIPVELIDAARVDGARPWQEFRHIVFPLTVQSAAWTALAVAILALGEISAGKIVATPGSQTFGHEVFTQMHYGVSNDLAAMCLLLLVVIVLGTSIAFLGRRRFWSE